MKSPSEQFVLCFPYWRWINLRFQPGIKVDSTLKSDVDFMSKLWYWFNVEMWPWFNIEIWRWINIDIWRRCLFHFQLNLNIDSTSNSNIESMIQYPVLTGSARGRPRGWPPPPLWAAEQLFFCPLWTILAQTLMVSGVCSTSHMWR